MQSMKLIFLVLIILTLLSRTITMSEKCSTEWLDPNWRYRVRIDLDFSWLKEDLYNFTLPLRIDNNIIDFAKTSPSGEDIVITDCNGKPLPVIVEYWNTSIGKGYLWIKLPHVKADSITTIYLYYGIVNPSSLPKEQESKVWSDYVAVIDMAGYGQEDERWVFRDLAGGDNEFILRAGQPNLSIAPTGLAQFFNGKNTWGYVKNISFYMAESFTVEALFYVYDHQVLYSWHKDLMYGAYIAAPYTSFFILYSKNITNPQISFVISVATTEPGKRKNTYSYDLTWLKNKWVYLVLTYDNSSRTYRLYINGSLVWNLSLKPEESSVVEVNPKRWGARYNALYIGANSDGFEKTLVKYDFVRVKYGLISDEYIEATYHVLFNNIVASVGTIEECPSPAPIPLERIFSIRLLIGLAIICMGIISYYAYQRLRSSKKF